MSHEIHLHFRTPPEQARLDFEYHLAMVQRFTRILGAEDALLGESVWYLCGDTKKDSYRYLYSAAMVQQRRHWPY
ncbi:hypothetical protein CBM2633_A110053 [Cupriavidus taiwanensis]|nr:hypothetical protein CBM2604_A120320 [Cupriavidus taiwanensis]SOZ25595.1 hypothetical protein CBM2609_A140320 [Cupriavidus taiwanensis]SOZ44845.1 hypothetical protein CBM2610_A150319 [Cupriavidus taiwanensis]SPA12449.1 hypothetical protein CBM2633_A110053 [Cupriavidus taiwanensis]